MRMVGDQVSCLVDHHVWKHVRSTYATLAWTLVLHQVQDRVGGRLLIADQVCAQVTE